MVCKNKTGERTNERVKIFVEVCAAKLLRALTQGEPQEVRHWITAF
jgi:hypothetical protein